MKELRNTQAYSPPGRLDWPTGVERLPNGNTLIADAGYWSGQGSEIHEGKKVYLVESIPKPDAPVVWGMQRLKIREDNLFLEQAFYDEDLKLVKILKFLEIQMLGGKLYPKKWIMQNADQTDKYTLVEYKALSFKKSLPAGLFTLSNLKKPKR